MIRNLNILTALIFSIYSTSAAAHYLNQAEAPKRVYTRETMVVTGNIIYKGTRDYSHIKPIIAFFKPAKLCTIYNNEILTYSLEEAYAILDRKKPNLITLISQDDADYDWDELFKRSPALARDGWFYSNPIGLIAEGEEKPSLTIYLK